jgi:hypothetical protein
VVFGWVLGGLLDVASLTVSFHCMGKLTFERNCKVNMKRTSLTQFFLTASALEIFPQGMLRVNSCDVYSYISRDILPSFHLATPVHA